MIHLPEGFNFALLISELVSIALPFIGVFVVLTAYIILKKAVDYL